ncbi:MAG: AAA family ATPase [Myxococcota bacterium]|nr:AAA family ATPase [Myxococcota bacterium]
MKRTIENRLLKWQHTKKRKPLIVRGARQVGKTFTISAFGRNSFDNLFIFDFERVSRYRAIFEDDLDPRRILSELEIEAGKRIFPGHALVFFDEIQTCPRAVASLRYFYEELPDLHVIAAGSLLELALDDISFPVGRVAFEWMRPMSFSEFLEGIGQELLAEKIPHFEADLNVSQAVHQKLIAELRRYFIVGGMPEAVVRFAEQGSYQEASAVHEAVVIGFLQSLIKYHQRANITLLEHLLEQFPRRVGQQIKYSHLDPHRHTETVKAAIHVLERTLLIALVRASAAQGLPLAAGIRPKVFKAIFLDIGLMQHLAGADSGAILHESDLTNLYRGALAEQFVAQELLATGPGSENDKLFYWSRAARSSNAEVDLLMVRKGVVHPVEIKAGAIGNLKSLGIFRREHPGAAHAFVLSPEVRKRVVSNDAVILPIYTNFGMSKCE